MPIRFPAVPFRRPQALRLPILAGILMACLSVTVRGAVACTGADCGPDNTLAVPFARPSISLDRTALGAFEATGTPEGGRFSYTVSPSGSLLPSLKPARGTSQTSNPNRMKLTGAGDTGTPQAGGLVSVTATYRLGRRAASASFPAATFGVSCYYTTAESEWGTPPAACEDIRINGVVYSGAVTNPYGLAGKYCSSFIAMLRLQGSAQLRDGRLVQYVAPKIVEVDDIRGADNTPVVPLKTVARDRSIIPTGGVRISLAGVGRNLLANDTGGAILGYRIDHYRGYGASACANYSNRAVIGACRPGNAACPGR